MTAHSTDTYDAAALVQKIKTWGAQLGFAHTAISDVDLRASERRLVAWLANNFHGEMAYMARHGVKRSRPGELLAGTVRAITVRMDYLPQPMRDAQAALDDATIGYISRYALGRDYHKMMRNKLATLARRVGDEVGAFGHRALCDSAPVLEKPLAQKSGHGWIGKHTNLINREHGSWFFLGELYTDLPLPIDRPVGAHCGSCTACIDICPTDAIVAPYQLDARRCISYLTIELKGAIPHEFREAIGNRIYGCDDCQLVCPWNRRARIGVHPDFAARHRLDRTSLIELFAWRREEFERKTEGSPIRRIGHHRWLRNIAVALGNAPASDAVKAALQKRRAHPSALVREHTEWALRRQLAK